AARGLRGISSRGNATRASAATAFEEGFGDLFLYLRACCYEGRPDRGGRAIAFGQLRPPAPAPLLLRPRVRRRPRKRTSATRPFHPPSGRHGLGAGPRVRVPKGRTPHRSDQPRRRRRSAAGRRPTRRLPLLIVAGAHLSPRAEPAQPAHRPAAA